MNIQAAKDQIENAIKSYLMKDEYGEYLISIEKQRPVFLLGAPGLGKTAIMEQIAQDMQINLVSYAMTHQTRETAIGKSITMERNFVGKDVTVSETTMSEIISNIYQTMEETGIREGILFLDEINCVERDIAPMMLQFLQYKIFGKDQIPEGWVVTTAGNPPEYNDAVTEFDIATLDRLKKIFIDPDYPIWKEYAFSRGIHNSITTYLDFYPEYFYVVPTDKSDREFVTGRGWEDMSEMMQLYEKNGTPVDLFLISQYVQKHEINQSFYEHYCRYNEIRDKYKVDDILAGNTTTQIMEAAKMAGEYEKHILINQLASITAEMIINSLMTEKMSNIIMPMLQDVVAKINAGFSNRQVLSEHIMELRKKVDKAVKARIISVKDKRIQHWILASLARYMDRTTNEARDKNEQIAIIQSEFDAIINRVNMYTNQGSQMLSNVFAFVQRVYGESAEMQLLVHELSLNSNVTKFIGKYGCDEYTSRIAVYSQQQ